MLQNKLFATNSATYKIDNCPSPTTTTTKPSLKTAITTWFAVKNMGVKPGHFFLYFSAF